ncbi:MAG: hypothetical protein DI577_00865 [Microbacterium sp.]|nr:MAG: hypothetical protein DI577_00865 [Microbacterium sp.]PZU38360.1 MAG: hypothetical protein DI575_00865 [Microbacterium sp.]
MPARRLSRGWAAATATLLAAILVGCGPAPWTQDQGSPSPTVTSSPVAPPVSNDLSGGATERTLTAGAVSATVNYWSTLRMDRWTATAVKPISLSMVTTITPNDGQKVYLQRATMTAVPGNATQSFAPLDPQVDQSTVAPGYLVLSPYSYSNTFNVGAVPADATFVTIQFDYDFLVQTTPTSTEYAKQTASDTLTVAIAAPAG